MNLFPASTKLSWWQLLFLLSYFSWQQPAVQCDIIPLQSLCNVNQQKIVVIMIYTKHDNRSYEHTKQFTSTVFAGINDADIQMRFLPPVYTESCDGFTKPFHTKDFDKGRGSNLAHIQAWDAFYRTRNNCSIAVRDTLIVFEYDAFLGRLDAGKVAIASIRNMTSDLHYLGYCFHKPHNHPRHGDAPYCLHAYAVSVHGAKILLESVDACGPFADVQLSALCNAKNLNWTYETQSYDHTFFANYWTTEGLHRDGTFVFDGVFLQAKLDPYLYHLPDHTVCHNTARGKEMHLLLNKTWRAIPNMDIFHAHGLDVKKVVKISDWQFRNFPEGSPLEK